VVVKFEMLTLSPFRGLGYRLQLRG